MSSGDLSTDPIAEVVEEYMERVRSGESPTIDEYTTRYPELAEQLLDVLPTLRIMQSMKAGFSEAPAVDDIVAPNLISHEFDDFRIRRRIGEGGMGVVYEAEQLSLGRRVAIKILRNQSRQNPHHQHRFDQEAKVVAKLHHSNIVPVFGVGEYQGVRYIVMQFIDGAGLDDVIAELRLLHSPAAESDPTRADVSNLARSIALTFNNRERLQLRSESSQAPDRRSSDRCFDERSSRAESIDAGKQSAIERRRSHIKRSVLNRERNLYWTAIAKLAAAAGDALHYAHTQGIIHRDIKPGNLMLDTRGEIWLSDFGLAKLEQGDELTKSGDLIGTLHYLPPEAFQGQTDARSDIYGLGITFYELIARRAAFEQRDRNALIKQIIDGEPKRLESLHESIPRDLATIIHKAIDPEPHRRYPTADEFTRDLNRFISDEPIRARRISSFERLQRWSRRNRPLAIALSSVAVLILLLAAGALSAAIYSQGQERKQRQLTRQATILADEKGVLAREKEHALQQAIQTSRNLDEARQVAEHQTEETRRILYAANMNEAIQASYGHRGRRRALDILKRWYPSEDIDDARGWEWYYVYGLCHQEEIALKGHTQPVKDVSWSRDGNQLASAGLDGNVIIWDVELASPIKVLDTQMNNCHCVDWHPSGDFLAAGGSSGVAIFSTRSGDIVAEISHDQSVFGAKWNPTGEYLAIALNVNVEASLPSRLLVYSRNDWKIVGRFRGGSIGLYTSQLSWASGTRFLGIPAGQDAVVLDFVDNAQTLWLKGHTWDVQSIAFHPTQPKTIATGARDSSIRIWDRESAETVQILNGHTHAVSRVDWHPNGRLLLSASWDATVRLWDTETGKQIRLFPAHDSHTHAVRWSPNGDRFATCGRDGVVRIWEPSKNRDRIDKQISDAQITLLKASPTQDIVCVGTSDGILELRDIKTGEVVVELQSAGPAILKGDFSPDGSLLVTSNKDGLLQTWELTSYVLLNEYQLDQSSANVAWSHDGMQLATGGGGGRIEIFHPDLSHIETIETSASDLTKIGWHPIGNSIAYLSGRDLYLRDLDTGKVLVNSTSESIVFDFEFDHLGKRIAFGGAGSRFSIWQVADNSTTHYDTHMDWLYALAWSPDSRRIAIGSAHGALMLWDSDTGRMTLALDRPAGELTHCRFSRTGEQLIAGDRSGSIQIWDASRGVNAADREVKQ